MRSQPEITALLDGWDLVPPGVVRCPLWRPDPGEAVSREASQFPGYSAVARLR
jgi:hypothetical protein